jgi:hypothetical protein
MIPWNALPWNTIAIIIGLSILIPTLLSLVFIRLKRYEDTGFAIGVFLLVLSILSYGYVIPQQIIHETMLPQNFVWEDNGLIHYWERNSVFSHDENQKQLPEEITSIFSQRPPIYKNFTGKEVIHAIAFDSNTKQMMIHDAIYDENGDIFRVINGQEQVSEWYKIDPYLTSLKYVSAEAGRMGIPSNPGGIQSIRVGWIESHGEEHGKENVVFIREMHKIKEGFIESVPVAIWQSDIYNKPITWHGEAYFCDETLQLAVHPETGYILHVYRHLVLSAHLSQFVKLYYPDSLQGRILSRYLQKNDPIGEAAELSYQTTNESQQRHLSDIKEIQTTMTVIPLLLCVPMLVIGLALIWRYSGRSYYWKRYKDFENHGFPQKRITKKRSMKKIAAVGIVLIVLISSLGYFIYPKLTTLNLNEPSPSLHGNDPILFEEEPPTPPGSDRAIDSGRHILMPVDEGVHKLARREWWYFNVVFDDPHSELKNWSMIVSFNKMAGNDIRFLKRDNLFVILYDEMGTSYNFGTFNKPRRTLQMGGPGVDVQFEDNWAQGQYPHWQIHVFNEEKGFTVDLNFTADFMPVWVIGRSSNLLFGKYFGGDYYIPRCVVNGTIQWENKEYAVSGIGYHDHVWETVVPRVVTKGWEWFIIHFDNGWEMYLSKFDLRTLKDRYAGAIVISPNNRNLVEYNKYTFTYTETVQAQDIPSIVYPKKCHLEADRDGVVLKLDIEIYNTCELVWKGSRTGMSEGHCRVKGTMSWSGHTVELNGFGMSEITRVKYLLELPHILR